MAKTPPDSIWLRPEPKGRQPGLTRAKIAAAALELADQHGFEALSMRQLAEKLQVGTMTLYHYVETKDDLVALMDDALMAQVIVPPRAMGKGWRAALTAIARSTREVFKKHPWALVSMRSAPPGPHAMAHFEQCLAALADTPIDAKTKFWLLGLIDDLVFGSALRSNEPRLEGKLDPTTARSIEEQGRRLFATGRFPEMAKVFGALTANQSRALLSSASDEERFERGLTMILDGVDPARNKSKR